MRSKMNAKKIIIAILVLMAFSPAAKAFIGVDTLYFNARAGYNEDVADGRFLGKFFGDHLNLNIYGTMTDKVGFRIRHRFNVAPTAIDPLRATDWASLLWHPSDKWSFTIGKQAILVGGYEYDAVPIDVYFYSNFCNNLPQGYSVGITSSYEIAEGQSVALQVANSPLSYGFSDTFAYNLAWQGHITSWWHTIWTVNAVEDDFRRFIGYVALGNHLVLGNVAIDLDLIDRANLHQSNLFSDYTFITKVIWSVGKWNYCGKIGFERNDAANVDEYGRAYDTVMAPGYDYLYGGLGVEYFPYSDNKLRLHAIWFRDSDNHHNNFQVGVTWRFDLIKR